MGHTGHHTRAVARVRLVANASTVLHAAVHLESVLQNFVTGSALNVADEADAAAVFFVGGIVQPVLLREVAVKCQRHRSSQLSS